MLHATDMDLTHALPPPLTPSLSHSLAETGVTDEATLLSPDNTVHPDYYMPQLSALLDVKQAASVAA